MNDSKVHFSKWRSLIGLKAMPNDRINDTFNDQNSINGSLSTSFSLSSLKSRRLLNVSRFISTKLTRKKSSALTPQSKTKFKAKEQMMPKTRPLISSPRAVNRRTSTPKRRIGSMTPNRVSSNITPLCRQASKLWIDSLPQHVANSMRQLLSVCELRRQEAIHELLSGEIDVCYDLGLIETTYQNSLLQLEIIDEREAFQIFGDLHVMYCVHSSLVQQIESVRDGDGLLAQIGPILMDWTPKLAVYEIYCSNQRTAKELLERKIKSDKRMSDFLERCLQSPFSRRLDLWAFLDVPRTRLVKYPLLFRAILKYTTDNSGECVAIQAAIDYLEQLISIVDCRMGESECRHLLSKIDYDKQCDTNICVSSATAIVCSGQLKNNRGTKLLCVLFDTCLILCRANEFGTYELYRQPILISELGFESGPHIKGGSNSLNRTFNASNSSNFFRVYSSLRDLTFTLQASDDHSLKLWLSKLKTICNKPSLMYANLTVNESSKNKTTPLKCIYSNQTDDHLNSLRNGKKYCNEDSFNEMLD